MNYKSKILLFSILMLPILGLRAQMVKGVVYEKNKDRSLELPGVNVHWAGSEIGTATDADGRFELYKPDKYHMIQSMWISRKR